MRLENYALIGDCETAALVSRDGSIDWLCWPDFSSPACFAALLGTKENGRWRIAPAHGSRKVTRRYREHTLILETKFHTETGIALLTDFMPVRERHSDVVRIVRCLQGRVEMRMELALRFDYGRTIPWICSRSKDEWTASAGRGVTYLRTRQAVESDRATITADLRLNAGEQRSFVLTYVTAQEPPPKRVNVQTALHETAQFWLEWTGKGRYSGAWKDAVERSLITLKALTYRPSGAIIAAPTTSLPEHPGTDRNWDYRYAWLRDGAFTLESLLSVGYHDEADAWQRWLLQSVGSDVRQMQIMYGVRGERHLPEYELPWLRGYHKSGPVRAGNGASEQLQLDVYGEVADAISTMAHAKIHLDPRIGEFQSRLTDHVGRISSRPSSGIWERRLSRHQFTYSKVMAWLALKHGVEAIDLGRIEGPRSRWRRARNALHREICEHGFSRPLQSFVQSYHSRLLDASSLLIPIVGFLPFEDERVAGTLRAIEKHLVRDELVYRVQPKLQREAAFLPCSFWLVQNYAGAGRKSDAIHRFERLLRLRNDVGLLAEEYNPREGQFRGNFPQALSHIALINAARALDRQG